MDQPLNVLFVIADQFRADTLGCAGNPVVRTPNLDRLAAEGTRFTHCFNQTAPCGPSRMAIYTGRYMCSHRAINNMTPLRDAEENFGYHLRQAGHNPGLIGYNDYGVDPATLPKGDRRTTGLSYDNVLPGFEDYYYHEYDSQEYFAHLRQKGYPQTLLNHNAIHSPAVPPEGPGANLPQHYPAHYTKEDSECRYVTDKAIQYIRERPQGWVLSLNYIKPHPPNICCPPYHNMYDPAEMPAAIRRPEELAPTHPYLQLLSPTDLKDDLHLRQYRACYYGMVTEVDDNLGLIFDTLDALDQWDNTLIIFTADHAEYLGDHYLTGKGHFHDSTMRIPYLIRDPSPAADPTRGRAFDDFVEAIDTAPTILDAMDVPIPDRFQGHSLLNRLRNDPSYRAKNQIHYEFDYRGRALAADPNTDPDQHLLWVIRDQHYKYIQFADPAMPPLLYDLQQDPGEFNNLADQSQNAALVVQYCQALLRWRMRCEDQRMEHWAQQYR